MCMQSEELKARLKKLADVAERKAYQELVKDIAPKKPVDEPFSSYKDQLGFGMYATLSFYIADLYRFTFYDILKYERIFCIR